jgi:hypothetical protein
MLDILSFLPFAERALTFISWFLGFGGVLMGHKVVVFIIKLIKAYFNNSSQPAPSITPTNTTSNKHVTKSVPKAQASFVKTLTIVILSMYFFYQHVYLVLVYLQDTSKFYVEASNFMDFLTVWAGISLAYYFFTKADIFFTEKMAIKRMPIGQVEKKGWFK